MTTIQQVELGVLGPLQVRQFGLPVAIPGAKPRAVLTMLGLHAGSVVAADVLVELLWGDEPPRTAAKALQTHISALRRALGDGFVVTQGTGWSVRTADVDATRYSAAAASARAAMSTGNVSEAVARFDEALRLWRGIPELPDGRRGRSERTRWIEDHAALVEDRADALLATGRAAEIIGELEAAIADAPLRERRWGHLMLALYRAGRQGEALAAFQRVRSLLAEELGVDPGPDLRRLEAAVVAQDDSLELPVAQHHAVVTRAVTFLLTDIEGSTAAWERDADAMAVALARHDEIVEQVVTSRGGRLVKTRGEGDATFSVFDRPSGAAAAAVELQEAMRHEPWKPADPLRIRIALHTGEVELRDGDYFGRAVNRAARLRSVADGGQILCSGATAELVIDSLADDVVLADLGTRQLKNLARPERVFELRLESADESRPPTVDAPIERPVMPPVLAGPGPFVGRAGELELLLAGWQATLDTGARAVLIAGEPGVGKTRLAGEWSRRAYEQGAVVLYGRCDEDLGAPYQPFAEALRSLLPCMGPDRLRRLRGVEALLPLVPGLTDVLPELASPTRADADTERYALFDAVVAVMAAVSASTPVVLVLDDLHWAAKPTLLLLRHLLRFGEHARVQIVGTYRSTDLDRSHPLAAMLADLNRDGTADRLQLGGLDEGDVTAYLAAAGYDDEDLARALASVTGGNPFFLIEALRHVDESGGRWDPSTLPQGVREAVTRRLSRLSVETNKALGAAAVVGSRFAVDLVERVVDRDLVDAFDEACKAGIVIEEPGGRYRFNHALVRQSLLAELASVRRMRLHQRIAVALETEPSGGQERSDRGRGHESDDLLAELAYHYFECAWAGNAAKAVDYCRRAADQAMARLAYEGAADLYDKALHALEELDDDLPDREQVQSELLIARCEALLAAGDVATATSAVAQLRTVAGDSGRLAAWGACFDGQLRVLTDPERLDEIESAVAAAASTLATLDDAAGEAKAHTVRATCLGRLGRIGDCESALDQALTAARRAREHRRVNNVLANAPLAALWGPNSVPRAGGRCLDVVRLLRITTGSPVVEATSTRCQGVLDAFRGRAAAGRQLIDSARRSLVDLGMRHSLLEVEQFAGIVELVADEPTAAEEHFRRAYNGFRRMGLEADTAETAALLARACLALGREAEADELCSESERLAGHALKASITWRTVRAQLLARGGALAEARRVAQEAVTIAEHTDALVDHGDACLALAVVLGIAGDEGESRAVAQRAIELYELKGAVALSDKARMLLRVDEPATVTVEGESLVEPDNACAQALDRLNSAVDRGAWADAEREFASTISVESRRKIVGFPRRNISPAEWVGEARRMREMGTVRHRPVVVAVSGERFALTRLNLGTADVSPGAPQDEAFALFGLDGEAGIAVQVWFEIEDLDAAMAELDRLHRQAVAASAPTVRLENAASRVDADFQRFFANRDWASMAEILAEDLCADDRRRTVNAGTRRGRDAKVADMRATADLGTHTATSTVLAVRGQRLALVRIRLSGRDNRPEAFHTEMLGVVEIDPENRMTARVLFDPGDHEAALAELDKRYLAGEPAPHAHLQNAATRVFERFAAQFTAGEWASLAQILAEDYLAEDRRSVVGAGLLHGRDAVLADLRATTELARTAFRYTPIAVRGDRLVLNRIRLSSLGDGDDELHSDVFSVVEITEDNRAAAHVVFDADDLVAALTELDTRYVSSLAEATANAYSAISTGFGLIGRGRIPAITPDFIDVDHRAVTGFEPGGLTDYLRAGFSDLAHSRMYIEVVHRLTEHGAVFTHVAKGVSKDGQDVEWRVTDVVTLDGDRFARCELFDDVDLDTALARFDELSGPTRLENTASRVYERYLGEFMAGDWDAMADTIAENASNEDRRRIVNGGTQRGRAAVLANMRAIAEVGVTHFESTVVAVRGEHLALGRYRVSGGKQPEAFGSHVLTVVGVDDERRFVTGVAFDVGDIDAAMTELDAQYLAGEAAPHARAWSTVAKGYEGFNRRQLSAMTSDFASIDHRRSAAFAPGELLPYMQAAWEDSPDTAIRVEAVHRLSDRGAVVTHFSAGRSRAGFHAEWRDIAVAIVDGDAFSRMELFDATDLDAALARFDEISVPDKPENAVLRTNRILVDAVNHRDLEKYLDACTGDARHVDRRRGLYSEGSIDAAYAEALIFGGPESWWVTGEPVATRGGRVALFRYRYRDHAYRDRPVAIDALGMLEVGDADHLSYFAMFDPDDLDGAFAELDFRYRAGEAAPYAHVWNVIAGATAAFNRREPTPVTSDCMVIDHRLQATLAGDETDDLTAYLNASWELTPDLHAHIETVHALNSRGALVTTVTNGTTSEGFGVDWRQLTLMTVRGELGDRCEIFDEAEIGVALERFEELSRPAPRLENAASRLHRKYNEAFARREWTAMSEMVADDIRTEDRRRVVSGGIQRGRDSQELSMRAAAAVGVRNLESTTLATRGDRLALLGARASGDQRPAAFGLDMLVVVELDGDDRCTAGLFFEPDDLTAAIAELDARYLAGEAAAHAQIWSLVVRTYAGFNRHELSKTTPDWVNIDHRLGVGSATGEMNSYVSAMWDVVPDVNTRIEAVHRLSDFGAVFTHTERGTSADGFDAEWREVALLTFTGDAIDRCELFDESDLDAALARFDERSRSVQLLSNAASRTVERFWKEFEARDWTAMASLISEDTVADDRRPVVGSVVLQGREANLNHYRALASVGTHRVTTTVLATREHDLALALFAFSGGDPDVGAFRAEALAVVEIDRTNTISARVIFDADNFDAAYTELDKRYAAGKAAPCADTWSVVAAAYAAMNRRELPVRTSDWRDVDHRRLAMIGPGELMESVRASWDLTPDIRMRIETVHRVDAHGAVFTRVTSASADGGGPSEWRAIDLVTVEGGVASACEIFDEDDLDRALARFDELGRALPLLGNAASRAAERFSRFGVADPDTLAQIFAADFVQDDRRRVVGAGVRHGRAAEIDDLRAFADVGLTNVAFTFLGTRGDRLALARSSVWGGDSRPTGVQSDMLTITEVDVGGGITALVIFDVDDLDAAYAELDARYLAGEAAPHAATWSALVKANAAFNRREMPPTTRDWVNVDNRRGGMAFAPGDMSAYMRATWDVASEVSNRIVGVHRLGGIGAVFTQHVQATSGDGFTGEWRDVVVLAVDGDKLSRCEVFDEADLGTALARFDELTSAVTRLENAASRVAARLRAAYAERDWDAATGMLSDDLYNEDRRRVVNAGVRYGRESMLDDMRAGADIGVPHLAAVEIATRGDRLVLVRAETPSDVQPGAFSIHTLVVAEVDSDNRITAQIMFDPDDFDAAIEELDARYLAGEAAAHGHAWSVVKDAYAAVNRHERPKWTTDFESIDHRKAIAVAPGELQRYVEATWAYTPGVGVFIEAVHRVNDVAVLVTHVTKGTSEHDFEAEWRIVTLSVLDGDFICRSEMFDEDDLDLAIARFDELAAAPRLENAATRARRRIADAFNRRDLDDFLALSIPSGRYEDRRRGLRDAAEGAELTKVARALFEMPTGCPLTTTPFAVRGSRLALTRDTYRDPEDAVVAEHLTLTEVGEGELICDSVLFDPDDLDAAFAELDARYLAGEAAPHARTWSLTTDNYAAFNRREVPSTTPNWVNVDHRRGVSSVAGDIDAYVKELWSMVPDARTRIEVVHRLNDVGAVLTSASSGRSSDGFAAEWKMLHLFVFDRAVFSRCEMFDEADLDVALARFDELTRDSEIDDENGS